MIPQPAIVEWARRVPWPTQEQVEQDLLLSRLIVEIASDKYLRDELVFRGGTCLHKLFTGTTHRYSEDLDYVRRTAGGIADLTRALTAIGERLDMKVNTQISQQPKVYFRVPFESGTGVMRIKVETNTFERSPVRPLVQVNHAVDSSWFAGSADVTTFALAELVSTKVRALFQRSKGRDLFDLWLAITRLGVDPAELVECFVPYRPRGYTGRRAELNLREKLADAAFRDDLVPLVAQWPEGYDIDGAAEMVIDEVFSRL